MKKLLLFILFFINLTICYSQKRDAIWCFGDSAGINFNTPVPSFFTSQVKGRGSCVSIGDSSGNLLFYAYSRATLGGNTTLVVNNQHQLMQNGTNIVGEGWYNELVIVPNPSNNDQFYLFSIGVTGSSQFGLYYTLVDMSYNGGLGQVLLKNQLVLNDTMVDGLSAVKHGNGRDWWLVCRKWDGNGSTGNNVFYRVLIDPSGVSNAFIQHIGSINSTGLGNISFTSDGSRLVYSSFRGLIELYNFNRCSGNLSNPVNLHQEGLINNKYPFFTGDAFSPNDSLLYVSNNDDTSYIFQYNLYSPTPAIPDTIATLTYPEQAGGYLRLAPDNKIYWSCAWNDGFNFNFPYPDTAYNQYNLNLSVINYPDSIGAACNFQPFSFYLGGSRTYYGLPNNPNYDLGALPSNPCPVALEDLTGTGIRIGVYPNPSNGLFKIINHENFLTLHTEIYSIEGKQMAVKQIKNGYLNLTELPNGLYFIKWIQNGSLIKTEKISIIR